MSCPYNQCTKHYMCKECLIDETIVIRLRTEKNQYK